VVRKIVKNLVQGELSYHSLTTNEVDSITDIVVEKLYNSTRDEVRRYLEWKDQVTD
jgi:hypothetical protein